MSKIGLCQIFATKKQNIRTWHILWVSKSKRKKAGSKKGVGSKTIYSYFFKRERRTLVNQYLHIYSFSIIPDSGYLAKIFNLGKMNI